MSNLQLIRLNIKELEGSKTLGFDIYTENGKLLFPKGTELSAGKILQLSYVKIFKQKEEPKQTPVVEVKEPTEPKKPKPFYDLPDDPPQFDSKISSKVRREVLTSTRTFIKDIENGLTPDLAICTLTSDILVNEVASKVEDVTYLGQLRMFDEYTYSHNVNVSALSTAMGFKIGLDTDQIKELALATLLHDIGKMRIPKEILNKPGRLTDREFELIKLHAPLGYQIIKDELKLPFSTSRVALEHQERFSGSGYPKGLKGDEIGLFSQICAIADVYDALISKRIYKPAKSSQDAIKIMLSEGSQSFNPALLYKFIHMCNYSETILE
jgi:HD-GYP domain-containing protein (c-di-GMP phosphodiesterase class II)